MTMEINALLIVQIFNFFIAYCILRFIVFEPGVAVITNLDETRRAAEKDLVLGQEELERKEAFNTDQKERRINLLRTRMPHGMGGRMTSVIPAVWRRIERLTPEEETQLINTMKESIVHRFQRRQL